MPLIALDGHISVPRAFSFDELRALPNQIEERSMLLGGRAIIGVRLGAVIASLGLKSWARFAVVCADDGYAANIPIESVLDCVLVYAVGSAPLPPQLGGPVRLLTRGIGRCSDVKGVARITFTEVAAAVEHACPHALARAAGTLVIRPGGQS